MISNVGPPALTLSAIAEMADLPADVEGAVSRIITLSCESDVRLDPSVGMPD